MSSPLALYQGPADQLLSHASGTALAAGEYFAEITEGQRPFTHI